LQNSINNSSDSIIRSQTSCKLRFKTHRQYTCYSRFSKLVCLLWKS